MKKENDGLQTDTENNGIFSRLGCILVRETVIVSKYGSCIGTGKVQKTSVISEAETVSRRQNLHWGAGQKLSQVRNYFVSNQKIKSSSLNLCWALL